MRKKTHTELVALQDQKVFESRLPFVVVLDDIRSGHNVGSMFRTADGAGVQKIWLCGITGYPPNPQVTKTALGAEQRVVWEHHQDVRAVLKRLKSEGYQIVFLEQMDNGYDYQNFQPRSPVCLVVGNEIGGISEKIVDLCDAAVEIEMAGVKNSLNVSVAFGIVTYHLRSVLKQQISRQKTGLKN